MYVANAHMLSNKIGQLDIHSFLYYQKNYNAYNVHYITLLYISNIFLYLYHFLGEA